MKKNILPILLILNLLALIGASVGYGVVFNFDYTTVINSAMTLPVIYVDFVTAWIANISFAGTTILIVLAGTGLGALLALIVLIRGFVVRNPFLGLLSFLSVLVFFTMGVSMVIPGAFETEGLRYINFLLNGLSSDLIGTLLLAATIGLTFTLLFLVFLLGFRAKPKQKVLEETITIPPPAPQPSTLQPAGLSQPSTNPASTVPPSQDQNLNDLIKMVMAEELTAMRTGYPPVVNPGFGVNMMPGNAYGMDLNLVRRVVVEELAKFQGHYISRPEVQTLIAQEIALIKAQLKIK